MTEELRKQAAELVERIACGAQYRPILRGDDKADDVLIDAAEATIADALATARAQAGAEMRADLALVMDQIESDLAGAHAEICKLQKLDSKTHTWPAWTPQANTLRWIKELRAKYALQLEDPGT